LAHELGLVDVREGAGQKSPFRDDKKAGSFSVQKSYFKDHAHDEHAGGHLKFVELARPGFSPKERVEFVIRAAGMEPEKMSTGRMKAVAKEKRSALHRRQADKVVEIPKLGMEEPGPMAARVRDRWNDGQAALADYMAKLAESRGWDERVMRALVGMNKTACPTLPWSDKHRGWAWMVEKPVFSGGKAGLVPVGFHARYKIFKKGEPVQKRWVYCPYIPEKATSAFQKHLQSLKVKLPAYPFVMGKIDSPRLVVILEGQFDAVSFALAFGWLKDGIPPGIVVFGLRGVSSPNVFLAAYGAWVRRHKPFIWIIGDNDEAGKGIDKHKPADLNKIVKEPSFIDRLRAQGCTVHAELVNHPGCKDFNDVWQAAPPSIETMNKWADHVGAGDLV